MTIYYQVQSSKNGKTWTAFNAHHKYDITTDYQTALEIYNKMLEFHKQSWCSDCKYHRIAKYEVKESIIMKDYK